MANLNIRRRSGFIVRGGVKRRETLWLAYTATISTVALGTGQITFSLNAAALALRPFTIVRSRGLYTLASDQIANSESQYAAFGHIVVTDQASAIGVTAVPTPFTEPASDWHVYETLGNRFVLSSAVGIDAGATMNVNYDSKAMRKVDLGEDLLQILETGPTGLTEGVIIQEFHRVLLKLH